MIGERNESVAGSGRVVPVAPGNEPPSGTGLASRRGRGPGIIKSRAEPSRAEPSRAEPSRAEPSRAMTGPRARGSASTPPDPRPAPPVRGHRPEPSCSPDLPRGTAHRSVGPRAGSPFRKPLSRARSPGIGYLLSGLLAVAALSALPGAAKAQTVLWQQTMTVGSYSPVLNITAHGWSSRGDFTGSALADTDFDYGGDTYILEEVSIESNRLHLFFDSTGTGDIANPATRDKLVLQVGTKPFDLGAGTYYPDTLQIVWTASGLDWTSGSTVTLGFVAKDLAPRPSGTRRPPAQPWACHSARVWTEARYRRQPRSRSPSTARSGM